MDKAIGMASLDSRILLEIIRTQAEVAKAGVDLGTVMDIVAKQSQQLTRAAGAVVELAEDDDMVYRAASGIAERQLGLRLKLNTSLSGTCVRERQILQCIDSETDTRVNRDACRRVGLRSMIVVPLNHLDTTVGVIKVMSAEVGAFSKSDIQILHLMSDLIAAAMFHATRFESNELYWRATHDALTGLANRALYYDRLRQSLALAKRHDERLAILNVDMDGLKPINDTLGHRAGDAALKEMASRISAECRQSDTLARMGGDEFAMILPRVTDTRAVEQYCARVSENISRAPWKFDNQTLKLRASIGYAVFPDDSEDMDDLIELADQAMYQIKRVNKASLPN
ncbi:sensor domain-containing diguanylate cyclase [Noviherbaspirillum autotrophicum]|uniref:Diguanylate cyclase n=1 Tax=Noviherbaspirillum autotrophicum TaxID=709839 RepID=A0A0C2BU02_9BURK|nr:sensor domain-containing diguanylate cyclase [Noviherbaspirillum autotrophicum]KIF81526.1 diguanylate cyclase [Noviherbaspirillum autotrophicum]